MPSEQKVVLVMTRHLSYNIHGTLYREKNKENKGMLRVNLTKVDEQKPQALVHFIRISNDKSISKNPQEIYERDVTFIDLNAQIKPEEFNQVSQCMWW